MTIPPLLRRIRLQFNALRFSSALKPGWHVSCGKTPDCIEIAANKQEQYIYIMSETANTPTAATCTPAGTESKTACCCSEPQKQSQPQSASAAPAAASPQKGAKRQGRKQH